MKTFQNMLEGNEDQDLKKLAELIVDLNLYITVSLDSKINEKLNAIETQLKRMGINPRSEKFKRQ